MNLKHRDEIEKAISSKALKPCPMCGASKYVVDGLEYHHTSFPLDEKDVFEGDFSKIASIPCVSIICENCGFIASLALSVLVPGYKIG